MFGDGYLGDEMHHLHDTLCFMVCITVLVGPRKGMLKTPTECLISGGGHSWYCCDLVEHVLLVLVPDMIVDYL